MKYSIDFSPKLFSALRTYDSRKFSADLMSGIIVGIVALPLAIAFGIASGVSPEKGLITAILGGFIVSLLGGCNVQIGGPTGAFIVIVSGIISRYGIEGLAIATVMAGIMLVLLGVLKLGVLIKFIPYPIIVGFTAGIALTIFSTQIKDLFGLVIEGGIPDDFISKWGVYFHNFGSTNLWALGTGLVSIAIIVLMPRISRRIPGSLAAIILVTLASWILKRYCGVEGIETIGDRYTINPSIPAPAGFSLNLETIRGLLPPAFTIAMLGAIESLLSATVADGVTGDQHNSNTELIAQGAANIIVPFFGGIPVTGAIARTMTNINNGGRTPVAGIIHAVILLLILLFLSPLTRHIPMACLAGVLVIVSYNMSEWRTIRGMMKNPRADRIVLFTTLLLTVIFDLTIAIGAGLLMAIVLFLRRVMESTNISVIRDQINLESDAESYYSDEKIDVSAGVEIYEIDGPFFFGIASKFDDLMHRMGEKSRVRIIRMRKVPFVDSTGLHNLENLIRASQKAGIVVILSGVSPTVRETLVNAGVDSMLGSENICDNIHIAADRANKIVAEMA